MYRAKAEAVSGTKVYAGGKWLTCCGNKIVRVGEYIWTDGRVVYGNHQEAQQPLVIPTPQKQDEGIPILIYDSQSKNYLFYSFTKRGLKQIDTNENFPFGFIINDSKQNVYFSSDDSVININVDDKGNIFKLIGYLDVEDSETLAVIKVNDSVIATFNSDDFFDRTESVAPFPVETFHADNYVIARGFCNVQWGFIENAENWAFIVDTQIGEITLYDNGVYLPDYGSTKVYGTANFYRLYFVTPNKITPLFHSLRTSLPTLQGTYDGSILRYSSRNFTITEEEIRNIQYPLGDDNYYRVTEIKGGSASWNSFNVTIYSKENKAICQFPCEPIMTYLMFRNFHGKYLIGVNNSAIPYEENIQDGLYLCKNGELELLIDGSVRNWRLRPMKKIKNWQNRIQEISLD